MTAVNMLCCRITIWMYVRSCFSYPSERSTISEPTTSRIDVFWTARYLSIDGFWGFETINSSVGYFTNYAEVVFQNNPLLEGEQKQDGKKVVRAEDWVVTGQRQMEKWRRKRRRGILLKVEYENKLYNLAVWPAPTQDVGYSHGIICLCYQ